MVFGIIMNRILRKARAVSLNADLDRPAGKCGVCGHNTYMIKESVTETVCVWCSIVALLKVLLVTEKDHSKVKASLEKELKIQL